MVAKNPRKPLRFSGDFLLDFTYLRQRSGICRFLQMYGTVAPTFTLTFGNSGYTIYGTTYSAKEHLHVSVSPGNSCTFFFCFNDDSPHSFGRYQSCMVSSADPCEG